MQTVTTVAGLRAAVARARAGSACIGFVPTMGNLHAGHYALIALARQRASFVVASIFVNPTQFGPNEDFAAYPRTPAQDAAGLEAAGVDLLFAPSAQEMYPGGMDADARIDMPQLTGVLCGAFRPGHFAGVATVVAKLFNQVMPDVAVFGAKDYQQLLVVRRLVRDLAFPIQIIGAPTLRDPDGLAKSSRNQYLSPAERAQANAVHRALLRMREGALAGEAPGALEDEASRSLTALGFRVDYCAIRRAEDLTAPPDRADTGCVALIAAWLGRARLIDNVLI